MKLTVMQKISMDRNAKDFLQQGKWAEFGRALEELEKILIKLSVEADKMQ